MKKRILMMLLAFVMVAGMLPVITPTAEAEDYADGTVFSYALKEGDILHDGVRIEHQTEPDNGISTFCSRIYIDGNLEDSIETTEVYTVPSGKYRVNENSIIESGVEPERVIRLSTVVDSFAVTATANPGEGGTVTGSGTYNHGTTVTLTATPNAGYYFVNWTENGNVVSTEGTEASYTFTATGARNLVANFERSTYTVTFNTNGGTAVDAITQDYNSTVEAPATTRTGFVFTGWATNSDGTGTAYAAGSDITVTGDMTLYAQWKHQHPICGASCTHNGGHGDVEWTPWDGTNTIEYDANDKAYVYLSADATPRYSLLIPSGKTLYLCLNGKTLETTDSRAIRVSGTLNLCDCSGNEAAKITGTSVDYDYGVGVYIDGTGVFNMYSGSVANCSVSGATRQYGGGVYVAGEFNMYGGAISSCDISDYNSNAGGGVYVTGDGVFTMDGGVIDRCKAKKGGGVAVANGGTFIMNNGTITGCNTDNEGGGLYIDEGSVNLAGGSITNSYTSNNSTNGSIWLNGEKADMTISGPVTIKGKNNVDLNIYKSSSAKGVIHFTENGSLVLGNGEKLRIRVEYMSKWSTKEATRFLTASSEDQRNALKEQITLKLRDETPKIYDYVIDNVHGLRFAERNDIIYLDPGTLTLSDNAGYCFETVTVTITPPADSRLVSLTAQTYSGRPEIITLVQSPEFENVYTFEMPAVPVQIYATFGIIREHALCQADNCNLDHAGHDILSLLPVSTEDELQTAARNGGSYYLANDVEISGTINVAEGKTLSLCLNGYSIRPDSVDSYGRAFQVERTGTFNLTDCKGSGAITGFTTSEEGGGVYNSGIFTMYNGTISNNKTYVYGGGVFNQGDAYIYGGTIANNIANVNGGGLYHSHSADGLLLSGSPTISGNTVNDADNNVYLDIALTIDENFAPATDIGITTAEFGRFAEAADGADIENIAVYEQYFASEGDFPIYTQGNALCIGYYITEDPTTENNYTVGVNSTNGASYQWYKVDIQEAVVTDENCSDASGWYDNYDADAGWTAVYDDDHGVICYFKVDMTPDDVLTVTCSGPVTGELMVFDFDAEDWYTMAREGDTYTYTSTSQETHLLYYVPADGEDAPKVKATLTRVDKEAVDGQTEAALKTGSLATGTYACQVTWGYLNTPDDTSDDYTIDSETVEYVKASPSSRPAANPSYPVVEQNSEDSDGTVSFSKSRATRGSTVTVTVTPDKYYGVGKVIVRDASGKEIPTTKNADGTYSFKMPSGKVTVEAVYVWENPFVDVAEDTFYIDAVEWTLKNGITEGTSATTFSPVASCTRAQMVTFLWRAAGCPEPSSAVCDFTDVNMDSYYGKAVLWAVENGITKGTSDTTFSPDMECSRAQMATFLCRMADGKAESDENAFVDVRADAYYADSVQWAVENGITEGTGEGKFSPYAPCTRGQMVTFLYRYYVK